MLRDGDYLADPETGCWLWQKTVAFDGYGRIYWNGRTATAHRTYWTVLRGPIADGLVVDHLCGVRTCVNPDHMQIVTRTENIRRSPHVKLSPDQVAEIRTLIGVIGYRRIAARYNVSPTTIRHIAKGRTWNGD